jgi:hypothetical protein
MSNNPENKDPTQSQPLAQASSAPANGPVKHQTTDSAIKSSIGGTKGIESTQDLDGLIQALEEKIAKTKKAIEEKEKANQHAPQVHDIASAYLMLQYQSTILEELYNIKRQNTVDTLKDPDAKASDRDSAQRFAKFSDNATGLIKDILKDLLSGGSNRSHDNPLKQTYSNQKNDPKQEPESEPEPEPKSSRPR